MAGAGVVGLSAIRKAARVPHPKSPRALVLALVLAAALPAPACAHAGTGLAGGFAAGVVHPLTGFDHMLAMIAVGLGGA